MIHQRWSWKAPGDEDAYWTFIARSVGTLKYYVAVGEPQVGHDWRGPEAGSLLKQKAGQYEARTRGLGVTGHSDISTTL